MRHGNTSARRTVMSALLTAGASGLSAATTLPAPTQPASPQATSDAATAQWRLRQRRTPDVSLVDHNGRSLRFYSDVMKNRRVIVNVMYSLCSNVCTPATRNLMAARDLLGEQAARLRFVSLSLTPLTDTPQALNAYRKQYGIEGDWTFLTGTQANMETVQRALGFLSDAEGDDLLTHSSMARYCDEQYQRWTHINTLAPARSIARMIRFEMA